MNKLIPLLLLLLLIPGCLRKEAKKQFLEQLPLIEDVYLRQHFEVAGSEADNDCGPVAEYQALRYMGYDYTKEQIIEAMGWHRNVPNITDTLIHHQVMLTKLEVNSKVKLSSNLLELAERIRADTPVVVLLRFAPTKYHWVVLVGFLNNNAYMSWGDGRLVMVNMDQFSGWFTGNAIMYFREE